MIASLFLSVVQGAAAATPEAISFRFAGDERCFETSTGDHEENGVTPEKIATEIPDGVAERVYYYYANPDVAMRSYATPDVGCSATMIGPNVMMTAAHCSTNDLNARFRLYTSELDQTTEDFFCQYLTHTFADMDLNLYWCHTNLEGERPGDKFGYLDFDLEIDSATGRFDYEGSRSRIADGVDLYSIWTNPIDDLGPGKHIIYSEGYIIDAHVSEHWGSPNLYDGPDFRCANWHCCGTGGCRLFPCGSFCDSCAMGESCPRKPARAVGVHSSLWAVGGASGSSQIGPGSNRILIGPLSTGSGASRYAVPIVDHLYWGYTDPDLTAPTGCLSCVADQLNRPTLSALGLSSPASYYGWVDSDLDGLFDVQHDLELLYGESSRDWYWLGFESHRRNSLWTRAPSSTVTIDSSDPVTGVATLSTVGNSDPGFIPVLSHDRLNLPAGRFYRISFMTYLFEAPDPEPLQVCLGGVIPECEYLDPPLGSWSIHVVRLRAGDDARLSFELKRDTSLLVAAVSVIDDLATMDFDSHDKRYPWRNDNTGGRAWVWPNGTDSGTEPDWAGVVYRTPSEPGDDDWSLRNRQLGLTGGDPYRVCFDHRVSPRDPLTGSIWAQVHVLNGSTILGDSVTNFFPTSSWQRTCTSFFTVPTDDNNLRFGIQTIDPNSAGAYLVDEITIDGPLLFADGFESGDTTAWSNSVP